MTLHPGFNVQRAAATPLAARMATAAQYAVDGSGAPRPGVLVSDFIELVTTRPAMAVAVNPAPFVLSKGQADGSVVTVNDAVQIVPIPAAPTANSHVVIVYAKQNDATTGDEGDIYTDANGTRSEPNAFVIRATAGQAAPAPLAPSLPTGALELARLTVQAGATATNDATRVTLSSSYQATAPLGDPVPIRSLTGRASSTWRFGSTVKRTDLGQIEEYMPARPSGGPMDPGRLEGWYPISGRTPSFETRSNGGITTQSITPSSDVRLFAGTAADYSLWGGCSYLSEGIFRLPHGGRWLVVSTVEWADAATAGGFRQVSIFSGIGTSEQNPNKSEGRQTMDFATGGAPQMTLAVEVVTDRAAGVVQVARQSSAGNIAVRVVSFSAKYLGPN